MSISGPSIKALVGLTRDMPFDPDSPDPFVKARPAGYYGWWPTTHHEVQEGFHPLLDITPFNPEHVGANSYDVTLRDKLRVYDVGEIKMAGGHVLREALVMDKAIPTKEITIPPEGLILRPGLLYLGATNEVVRTRDLIPHVDGRSSIGRFGISVHATAGRGDAGFCGTFTLEISVIQPVLLKTVILHRDVRIAQLTFEPVQVLPGVKECAQYKGRYQGQVEPTASRFSQG